MPFSPTPKGSQSNVPGPTAPDESPRVVPVPQGADPPDHAADRRAAAREVDRLEADLAGKPDLRAEAAAKMLADEGRGPAPSPIDVLKAHRDAPDDDAKRKAALDLLKKLGPLALDGKVYTVKQTDKGEEIQVSEPNKPGSR